jgi:hypothetical protein
MLNGLACVSVPVPQRCFRLLLACCCSVPRPEFIEQTASKRPAKTTWKPKTNMSFGISHPLKLPHKVPMQLDTCVLRRVGPKGLQERFQMVPLSVLGRGPSVNYGNHLEVWIIPFKPISPVFKEYDLFVPPRVQSSANLLRSPRSNQLGGSKQLMSASVFASRPER